MFTHPDFQYRAAGVIVSNGHILLCRLESHNYWTLPGATMHLHQQAVATLENELLRQTCLKPSIGRLIWAVNSYFQVNEDLQHEVGLYHLACFPQDSAIYHLDTPFYGCEDKQMTFQWFPRRAEILEKLPLQPIFLAHAVEKLPAVPEYILYRDSGALVTL